MKKIFRQNLKKIETKLFPIGLGFLFCSIMLGIVTKIYGNFIFKSEYYRSLTPSEQQEWWQKLISLEQAPEFFRTPLALILLISTIATALTGLMLMIVSIRRGDKTTERRSAQKVEQFLKENPPKKRRKT